MSRINFPLFIPLIAIISCGQPEKPLTREEVMAFARKVEISVAKRDPSILDGAIDVKSFAQKIGKDAKSIASDLRAQLNMGTRIIEAMSKTGTYQLIKYYEKDRVPHLLFRLYADHQLNYHDYEMTRANASPKIADIYIYISGETLSQTIKMLWSQMNDERDAGSDEEFFAAVKEIPKLRSLLNQGKYIEASEIYTKLPQRVKNNKVFQLVHVQISSKLSDDEYSAALDEYKRLYPNDPNTQLLLVDAFILKKDYMKALDAINSLDSLIDKDPLLDLHRAGCYTLMNDDAKRMECLERLVKNMPDFDEALLALTTDYLKSHQFEKAKPLITRYESNKDFDQSKLRILLLQYPDYERLGHTDS